MSEQPPIPSSLHDIRFAIYLWCADTKRLLSDSEVDDLAKRIALSRQCPTPDSLLAEAFDAGVVFATGDHLDFQQTHPNKEQWLSSAKVCAHPTPLDREGLVGKLGKLTTHSFGRTPLPYYLDREEVIAIVRQHEATCKESLQVQTSEISDNEPLFHDLRIRTDIASAFAPELRVIPTLQAMELIHQHSSTREPVSVEACAIAACEGEHYTHDINTPDCAAQWRHNKEMFLRVAKAVLNAAGVKYAED